MKRKLKGKFCGARVSALMQVSVAEKLEEIEGVWLGWVLYNQEAAVQTCPSGAYCT